ncbi:MAG: AAA family ATPase [bacterium]|nr:AAA family ATPase [bacterium]
MYVLEGYNFAGKVYENASIAICRGTRIDDNIPVIGKFLKSDYPSSEELKRLEYEFNIGRSLDIPGVAKYYSLESTGYGKVIIMEDFGAFSLHKYVLTKPVQLDDFFRIAVEITDILAAIHSRNIIHKDLKPHNILINRETKEIKLIDFSISTRVKRETERALIPQKLKGTLAYISPEQTGRMNRTVDYRTDFYSLGVTFYEILTGKLPFDVEDADDPMEQVHAHIARKAVEPHLLDATIPSAVSAIIMKLLAKNAEERYQSGEGLKIDLLECQQKHEAGSPDTNFTAGKKDISDQFMVPEKLYGRAKEIKLLLELFSNAAKGKKEAALFTGPTGIGKSALINEIYKPVTEKRAYFLSGKYEQFERYIPYHGIIRAFSGFIRQLLGERESKLKMWRNKLLDIVGANGQVVIDFLPRMELIIGRQPEVPTLPPMETQRRLHTVFRDLLSVFAQKEHPLVLFLDDLQWADQADLQLLEVLLKDQNLKYLLFIGSYRDQTNGKPKSPDSDSWKKSWKEVRLQPLDTPTIGRILAETMYRPIGETKELAQLVSQKTHGNPFFIHEFLNKLQSDNLLEFRGKWSWDISKIQQADITDNVADLMAGKLKKLAPETQQLLKIAACLEASFPFELLAQVAGKPAIDSFDLLKEAIDDGILLKIGQRGKFSHDKVQEAVYSSLNDIEKKELHLKIGQTLMGKKKRKKDNRYFKSLVNHLNQAKELLSDDEKLKLARKNLKAGRKVKTTTAYEAAFRYYKQGVATMCKPWQIDYDLALALHTECGEAGYLSGHLEEADLFFDIVIKEARTPLDKLKVYEIKILILTGMHKPKEALELGKEALKMLDFPMPRNCGKAILIKEYIKAKYKLRKIEVEELLELPELTDSHNLAVARLLTSCVEPCYICAPDYMALIVLKLLNFTLEHGNCKYSAFAYGVYGVMLCSRELKIDEGYKFGELALKVLEKYDSQESRTKIFYLFGGGILQWKEHTKECLKYLIEARQCGEENGELSFASYALINYLYKLFFMGEPLLKLKDRFSKNYPVVKKCHNLSSIREFELLYQLIHTLAGSVEDKVAIKGTIADETEIVRQWTKAHDMSRPGGYYTGKMMLQYLYGFYQQAMETAEAGKKYLEYMSGNYFVPYYNFYYALSMSAYCRQAGGIKKAKYLAKINRCQRKLKKWATHAPENFLHKYQVVKAEKARISGDWKEAMTCYGQAAASARQNGFTSEEAVINECAASFYLSAGMDEAASIYIKKAYYLYSLWGATFKVEIMEQEYPQLIHGTLPGEEEPMVLIPSVSDTIESTNTILDSNAVIKASYAISGEIVMEKLLGKLIHIVMENAGAEKALLFLEKNHRLFVEGTGCTENNEVEVMQSIPLEVCNAPRSIIRFVERTREVVVLNESSKESQFSGDSYIRKKQPRSLMCIPVVQQEQLIAVLYLENNLSTGAFTWERQETLKVLAGQVAVSLSNAMLYDNLMRAEGKVRTILETTAEGFLELDNKAYIMDVNPAMCTILGLPRKQLIGSSIYEVSGSENRALLKNQAMLRNKGESSSYKLTLRRPDKTEVHCLVNATPLFDESRVKQGSFSMVTDITQYEEKDKQLRQAQKMETIGNLAGGLAHDFNNVLGGIIGSLSILKRERKKTGLQVGPQEGTETATKTDMHDETKSGVEANREANRDIETDAYLEDIERSANRAAEIVKRLLALSRKEELSFAPVDLNTTVRNVMEICRNTLEKCIQLNPVYRKQTSAIYADATQMEQLLLNICINAAHAMTIMRKKGQRHLGGKLTVSINKLYADAEFCRGRRDIKEGSYYKLSIKDEGIGMTEETISRVFEPFFTTKSSTKGSGLGLSMVYNIVKQHNGFTGIDSIPGKGTAFNVYFPELVGDSIQDKKNTVEENMAKGEGLILVIDDEPIMRKIAVKVLEDSGYEVIAAEDGEVGLETYKKHYKRVRLVLLDMLMPKMSGKETYIEMKKINPDIVVLLTSGFRDDERVDEVLSLGVSDFIEKPYTFAQLSKAVDKILA